MSLTILSEALETYEGRDKVLRLLTYLGKLGTGISTSKDVAAKSQIFASQISGCRVILRLLDDIPTINSVLSYGCGTQEPDLVIRWASLLQNLVDIIYCPIEHTCWAGRNKLVSVSSVAALDDATTWCWLISLYLSLVKCVRKISQLEKHKACLQDAQSDVGIALNQLKTQQRDHLLTSLRLVLDLSYAVSYLPEGYLWGGKMKNWHVGAIGTVSSLIVIYQMLKRHAAKK